MKKIVKLTENDLISLIKMIIKESSTNIYYDQILDLYNEVGLEGMTEDEIEYLKSGGESELPERFKEEESLDSDDEHFAIQWENLDMLKRIVERVQTDIQYPYDDEEKPLNLYFVIVFKYHKKLFEKLTEMFGDKPINAAGKKVRPVKLTDNDIWLTIPKSWFDELFSEPM
jgi:hypothetical protein